MMRSLGVKVGLLLLATGTILWAGWDGLHERALTTVTRPSPDHPAPVSAAPRRAPPDAVPVHPGPRRHEPPASIDVNRATAEELATLPGVGDVLAARIVKQRETSGLYGTIEQLLQVRGIGDARLARLRPFLHASSDAATPRPQEPARTGRRGS